ncbi:hypothetical protein Lcin_0434 [Legionella cincinnatiensis]|uniref:Uncharacterized protein n=1 Tax=Legionella cincinnatiensis TaxID=28085 RepID=A0ABR5QXX3_9GAMM|nr:hypothetical protein Lcin_0434 [Legionella cincinnatiensis]
MFPEKQAPYPKYEKYSRQCRQGYYDRSQSQLTHHHYALTQPQHPFLHFGAHDFFQADKCQSLLDFDDFLSNGH